MSVGIRESLHWIEHQNLGTGIGAAWLGMRLTLSFGSSWLRMWAGLQTGRLRTATALEGPKN